MRKLPATRKEKVKPHSFSVTDSQLKKLKKAAKARNMSMSDLIRFMINDYIQE
jgi:hypothetical protein